MRRNAFLALGLAIVASISLSATTRRVPASHAARTQPQTRKASPRAQATAVQEIDAEGLKKLLRRDSKQARPLLVNFWATWCDPCRDEFPDLVQIDKDYKARGLEFVTVSLDDPSDIKTSVVQFLQTMHSSMPAYLLNVVDPEPSIKGVDADWGGGLPATFLFDAQGRVVFRHMGRIQPAELRIALDKTLNVKR
ncbi:MAG TPA: redoxin domain-containing protein [Pyrinomonadaceae bacterium]|jgi:thiol-disulfide isomerase/thioredoxin|nr:redoxin domain-containing protein [Pyrinomonadaceae bacterium]